MEFLRAVFQQQKHERPALAAGLLGIGFPISWVSGLFRSLDISCYVRLEPGGVSSVMKPPLMVVVDRGTACCFSIAPSLRFY